MDFPSSRRCPLLLAWAGSPLPAPAPLCIPLHSTSHPASPLAFDGNNQYYLSSFIFLFHPSSHHKLNSKESSGSFLRLVPKYKKFEKLKSYSKLRGMGAVSTLQCREDNVLIIHQSVRCCHCYSLPVDVTVEHWPGTAWSYCSSCLPDTRKPQPLEALRTRTPKVTALGAALSVLILCLHPVYHLEVGTLHQSQFWCQDHGDRTMSFSPQGSPLTPGQGSFLY